MKHEQERWYIMISIMLFIVFITVIGYPILALILILGFAISSSKGVIRK